MDEAIQEPDLSPWNNSSEEPLIKLRSVTKKYGDFTAIKEIDLDIYKNEFQLSSYKMKSFYGGWLLLLSVTIVLCLGFDIWDFSQVALGNK